MAMDMVTSPDPAQPAFIAGLTYYSRVTRKGQATIPSVFRKKLGIEEGDRVVFEEAEQGLILKPAADVEDYAGAMSSFGDAGEVLGKLLRDRKNSFR